MLVMTMPAQGAHELGEVAHAHLSGCADSAVEEQAGTVCAHPAFGSYVMGNCCAHALIHDIQESARWEAK